MPGRRKNGLIRERPKHIPRRGKAPLLGKLFFSAFEVLYRRSNVLASSNAVIPRRLEFPLFVEVLALRFSQKQFGAVGSAGSDDYGLSAVRAFPTSRRWWIDDGAAMRTGNRARRRRLSDRSLAVFTTEETLEKVYAETSQKVLPGPPHSHSMVPGGLEVMS